LIAQRQELLKPDAAAQENPKAAQTFDTHNVDNKLPEIDLNTDLIEEAKQLAQQKAYRTTMT